MQTKYELMKARKGVPHCLVHFVFVFIYFLIISVVHEFFKVKIIKEIYKAGLENDKTLLFHE